MKESQDTWENQWDEAVEELIGWNYGTIHKQYDTEETCEVLEEDTRERLEKLKALVARTLKDN